MTRPEDLRFPTHWVGAVYQAMCAALSPELIREFWEQHRVVESEPLPLVTLFNLLMDKHATVPAVYDYRVTNSLELFCVEHDIDPEEFVRFASYMSSYHPFYSPEQILFRATQPIVSKLATIYDTRRAVISLLQQVTSSITPEHVARSIKKVGPRDNIITLRYPGVDKFPFTHDYHFNCRIQISHAPSIFGAPPFSRWVPLADARLVEVCLRGGETVAIEDRMLKVNGEVLGQVVPSFVEHCRDRHDLALGPATTVDRPVVLVEKDYRCPKRKRTVLARGCVYDAPYYLARIGYDPIPVDKEDYVRRLFTMVSNADRVADRKVTEMHAVLTSSRLQVVFDADEQSCRILADDRGDDGAPMALLTLNGVEARAMCALVQRLVASGETSVLVPCQDIVGDVYGFDSTTRPRGHRGFYVALKRMIAKVNRDAGQGMQLRMESFGRAKKVQVSCPAGPVSYQEN